MRLADPDGETAGTARRGGLIFAVALGLCAALVIGGVALTWSGSRTVNRPVDCTKLSPEECAMEEDIVEAWAQRQVAIGTILMGLGTLMGLALWITERRGAARRDA